MKLSRVLVAFLAIIAMVAMQVSTVNADGGVQQKYTSDYSYVGEWGCQVFSGTYHIVDHYVAANQRVYQYKMDGTFRTYNRCLGIVEAEGTWYGSGHSVGDHLSVANGGGTSSDGSFYKFSLKWIDGQMVVDHYWRDGKRLF